MSFDVNSLDDFPSAAADRWLDEALRAVPLPDGFLRRMSTLADSTQFETAESRELFRQPTRAQRFGQGSGRAGRIH